MPQINPHIINLKESATLAINQKARKARAKGEDVYHFGFGQSPFPVHKNIQKALCDHASEKDYLPTLGLPALREKISEFYQKEFGYNLDPSCICIGPGSKELIFQALFVLEGSVIIPAPSWVSYGPQVNLRGKHITRILTKFENGYKLCPDELEKTCVSLSEPQKILIINSPNNPTGAVYSDEEISALVDVCREQNVLVVSDEIYSLIDFSEKRKKGFMHFYPEGTLLTAGLSKSHSAGGYRLGFLASSPQLEPIIKALSTLVSETFSSVSAPTQYAAVVAYSQDPEVRQYVDRCTAIHQCVGSYLYKRLLEMDLNVCPPDGAFYLYPNFNSFSEAIENRIQSKNVKKLCQHLYDDYRVAVLPGTDFYGLENDLSVRMAYVDYDGEKVFHCAETEELNDQFVEKNCPSVAQGCDQIKKFLDSL